MNDQFCCERRKYYSFIDNLKETLDIRPRVVTCCRHLKCKETNEQIIKIINNGIYARPLWFNSDSPNEVFFQIKPEDSNKYLEPTQSIEIRVCVKPKSKNDIDRRRNIYIESEHPKIIFEVPIVVTHNLQEPSYANFINFPRSVPGTTTYYEMVLYNPLKDPIVCTLKSPHKMLSVLKGDAITINKKNFARVLLVLNVKDENDQMGDLKIKFTNIPYRSFKFFHHPAVISLIVNVSNIDFGQQKYEREESKQMCICNESKKPLEYELKFLTNLSEFEIEPKRSTIGGLETGGHNIANAASVPKLGFIAPQASYDSLESSTTTTDDNGEETPPARANFSLHSFHHFELSPIDLRIEPLKLKKINVKFRPVMHPDCDFHDDLEPPFHVKTKIFITAFGETESLRQTIVVCGYIDGPQFEITPQHMELRSIFLGEEHCREIKVRNIDGILPAFIKFKDYGGSDEVIVRVEPEEGYHLDSCRSGIFSLCLFTITIGRFMARLRFKVKNGKTYTVILRGDSRRLQLTTFPEHLEFGSVPIGVPQKHSVLVVNPLYAPICIQMQSPDDGVDIPLVLNVQRVDELPPITIADPVKLFYHRQHEREELEYGVRDIPEGTCMEKSTETESESYSGSDINVQLAMQIQREIERQKEIERERRKKMEMEKEEKQKEEAINTTPHSGDSRETYRSVQDDASEYSTEFEELVLDTVPKLAERVVSFLKTIKLLDKTEPEKKIVSYAVHRLLKTGYFDDFKTNQNFAYINWNDIPSDPKELYYDNEIVKLGPNNDRKMTIILIPNKPGYYNRSLELRICPQLISDDDRPKVIIDSEMMITKIWIEYNCVVPEIDFCDTVRLEHQAIYSGQYYDFEMEFQNDTQVAGFIFYEVVPDSPDAVMTFTDNIWKFHIPAGQVAVAKCRVMFRRFGPIRIPGMIRTVGQQMGKTFTIEADVLPPIIRLSAKEIVRRQDVLLITEYYLYIDNITPTVTELNFTLKNERFQFIEPYGAILRPGQSMYLTLHSKFFDPQISYNLLTIDVNYGDSIEIPITYNITNMPIIFDPNIRCGLDAGNILVNSKENFDALRPKYEKIIYVYNKGLRSYRLNITKIKSSPKICVAETMKARFTIYVDPHAVLTPGSINLMHVTADAYEEMELYNEFRVTIVDKENKQRFLNIRFIARAKFIQPELQWNRREICVNYNRSHKFKEHIILDLAELTNIADVPVEDVQLKAYGPFRFKCLFEENFVRDFKFEMGPMEKKDVFVVLNKGAIKDQFCKEVIGRITCTANGRYQRTLPLKVTIFNPQLVISSPCVILFTDNYQSNATIYLENVGCLDADYKWVKIDEIITYVEAYDDSGEFAHDLLSDIFRMLELNVIEDDPPSDYLYETNLTLRYQNYRCRLRRLQDTIGVGEIINEIINNLDLEHKRYMLTVESLDAVPVESISYPSSIDNPSARECASQTIEQILKKLNIEDDYTVTPASPDECMMEYSVYFYSKAGIIPVKGKTECLIHLPPVRKGHEVKATFELQVVGSQPTPFTITLVNLSKTIEISRSSIYLGTKPWYEAYKVQVKVRNITQYCINVCLEESPCNSRKKCKRIHEGNVRMSERFFSLPALGSNLIKFEGVMGFCDEFTRIIKFEVNDSSEMSLKLRGQGVMPILSMRSKISHLTQTPEDILLEYKMLQRIYYFDVFASITEEDEIFGGDEENKPKDPPVDDEDSMYDFSIQSSTSFDSQRSRPSSVGHLRRELRFFRLMQTYVIVNNNEEIPNALVLEQLIETEKFVQLLKTSMEACCLLNSVYESYLKMLSTYDKQMPINLKYFTVQPLPFIVHGYKLDLPDLKMNQFHRYEINLQFFGPGKLIAAIRTEIKIPGMLVDFEVAEQEDKKFIYYSSEEKQCSLFCQRYRNMYEREVDAERDPTLKHAHSFDHSRKLKHLRKIPNKDRKNILNYYNSLNKSVYADRKHHFILCKIFSNWSRNYSGTNVKIVILIKPEPEFYEDGQLLEDFLYLDLHMGPTMPILLRGIITK